MTTVGPYPRDPQSNAHSFRARDGTMVTYDPESRTVTLPELKTSDNVLDRTKPLPTSLQSDFLPEDLLLAITNPPPHYEKLGPPTRYRNLDTTAAAGRKKPAGVWTNSIRRDKYKHLTDNTPCVCGAGKDISFLYDVPKREERRSKTELYDTSEVRKEEELDERPKKKVIRLPDTLIPEEYHIVKNKGVMGLEYYEDTYATQPDDHESHLVVFPSMNPTSRYEVMQLRRTLESMLDKVGLSEDAFELKGPTQMHNLLELIKKEQNIYNVVFHELIRQASVECVERGELLAEIRGRYNSLVNKIPRQIKGLHEEVLAQRALDRRLTEELMRFKNTISMLTSELSEVKEHDEIVTSQAQQAQEDLKSALAESQKNASLLAEYHDLYELQRLRLEKQVNMLNEEKEIWSIAAYSLALKVTEEHSLSTAKRLHISEKAWAKLANHFTIMLSDQDTDLLTALQGFVDRWRDMVAEFNTGMKHREEYMREQIQAVRGGVQHWINYFHRSVFDPRKTPTQEGHFQKAPEEHRVQELFMDIKRWEEILSDENEKYGGDLLLSGQELLKEVRFQVVNWTDCAINIFNRHKGEPGEMHPDHAEMLKVNDEVDRLVDQFGIRLTGENGTAIGIINTGNSMEVWDSKLTAAVHGKSPISEQDWLRLCTQMDDWQGYLTQTLDNIGSTQREDEKAKGLDHISIDVVDTMRVGQKWLSSTTNSIDSEDAKLVEAVSSLHTEMIKWMVQMLLRLAPDRADHSAEAREAVLLGTVSVAELQANAKSLFQRLFNFSSYVTQCCIGIVNDEMQRKLAEQDETAEHELRELHKLQGECDIWIATAKLLLDELSRLTESVALQSVQPAAPGQGKVAYHDKEKLEPQERPPPMGAPTTGPSTGSPPAQAAPAAALEPSAPPAGPAETLEIIGIDSNTHGRTIQQLQKEEDGDSSTPGAPRAPQAQGPAVPDTKKAFEALAAVGDLQEQLVQTEERAQLAESKTLEVEHELKDANECIRDLERKITALEIEAVPQSAASTAKPTLMSNQNTTLSEQVAKSTAAVATGTPVAGGAQAAAPDTAEAKDSDKTKEKKGSSSRASSRTSNKSRKK